MAVAILLVAAGLVGREPGLRAGAGVFVIFLSVVAPALRVRRTSPPIILSVDDEGLIAETRTTDTWPTIRGIRRFGPRRFAMVTDECAIVVADRPTTPENLSAPTATFRAHMPA